MASAERAPTMASMGLRFAPLALLAPLLVACAATTTPPSRWAAGGARLDLPNARWVVGDEIITMRPDGIVERNGEFELGLDRAGRVFDEDNEPIALLEPDGHVHGNTDADLGRVGMITASLPGSDVAWIAVLPDGQVTQFGVDGERMSLGSWVGCNVSPSAALACTLATHLITMRYQQAARSSGVSVGVGVGVGVGFGPSSYGGATWSARPPFAPGPMP